MKAAIFSCQGLGDGLLVLILSHNLRKHGYQTTTFHPSLGGLKEWFPELPIAPFSNSFEQGAQAQSRTFRGTCKIAVPQKIDFNGELAELYVKCGAKQPNLCRGDSPPFDGGVLQQFDRYFLIYENSPWMQKILKICQEHYWEKTYVLNPIATPNCDYPYWEHGRFDGRKPFAENLEQFCKVVLKLPHATKDNGIKPPLSIKSRQFMNRVVMHPTSSRAGKNWSKEKYILLSSLLKKEGFDPVFVLAEEERRGWENQEAVSFSNLSELAAFVAESGYMIGNDSGVGHLASCLGLPTITICRSKMAADFWRPAWSEGIVVVPPGWIPNLKGLRLRDQHWQKFISAKEVFTAFLTLIEDDRRGAE